MLLGSVTNGQIKMSIDKPTAFVLLSCSLGTKTLRETMLKTCTVTHFAKNGQKTVIVDGAPLGLLCVFGSLGDGGLPISFESDKLVSVSLMIPLGVSGSSLTMDVDESLLIEVGDLPFSKIDVFAVRTALATAVCYSFTPLYLEQGRKKKTFDVSALQYIGINDDDNVKCVTLHYSNDMIIEYTPTELRALGSLSNELVFVGRGSVVGSHEVDYHCVGCAAVSRIEVELIEPDGFALFAISPLLLGRVDESISINQRLGVTNETI